MPLRTLLLTVMLAVTVAACGAGSEEIALPSSTASMTPYFVYVGTATGDPAGGIFTLRFDPETGALTRAGDVTPILNPSFLALAPDARTLYAVSEMGEGAIAAYRVDPETGMLTELNRQSSGGAGPAYVSVDTTGLWVLTANYGGGSVTLLPVEEGGQLGAPADVVQHAGSGPNVERQEGPHAHYARVSPDNRYVYAADLGIDRVIAYPLDVSSGSLNAEDAVEIETAPGAGPRHLDFHPNGRFAYLMNELNGTVTAYAYDAATGDLAEIHTVSALPDTFAGTNKSADIHVHPSGRWLYASNRGDYDSIALFAIHPETGRLTPAGHQREGITWPRNFAIDPTGRYLLVANRHADEVRVFTLDPASGRLTLTDHRAEVPSPTNVTLAVPAD